MQTLESSTQKRNFLKRREKKMNEIFFKTKKRE